jgi:hypothetical protein
MGRWQIAKSPAAFFFLALFSADPLLTGFDECQEIRLVIPHATADFYEREVVPLRAPPSDQSGWGHSQKVGGLLSV